MKQIFFIFFLFCGINAQRQVNINKSLGKAAYDSRSIYQTLLLFNSYDVSKMIIRQYSEQWDTLYVETDIDSIEAFLTNLKFKSNRRNRTCVCMSRLYIDFYTGNELLYTLNIQSKLMKLRESKWRFWPSDALYTRRTRMYLKKWKKKFI